MRKNQLIVAASCLLAQAALGQVTACDIQVINRGFEDPILANDHYSYFIPGWIVLGDAGSFNPGPQTYPNGQVAHGNNCGYVSCCTGGRDPGVMIQTLPAVLVPETTYELTLDIGQRLETPWSDFRLQLIAGTTPVIDTVIDTPPLPGTWVKKSFQFFVPPNHAAIGTRLQIKMTHIGDIEHQANFDDLTLTAQSNCVKICSEPASVQTGHGVSAFFDVAHSGVGPFTYQWSKDDVPLVDGVTPWGSVISGTNTYYLVINDLHPNDNGAYKLVIGNDCGNVTSQNAMLRVCMSDFNCDGVVDFFDYLDFVDAFAMNAIAGDYNEDGIIDFFDYLDFVNQFSTGC